MRAYQKKFELSRSNGSWDMGSGKFKIWKTKNLGFFEKWPPGPPQKGKKPKKGYFWSLGTQMAYQKNFRRFLGRGVEKYVAAHWTAPNVNSSSLIAVYENMTIHSSDIFLLFEDSVVTNPLFRLVDVDFRVSLVCDWVPVTLVEFLFEYGFRVAFFQG